MSGDLPVLNLKRNHLTSRNEAVLVHNSPAQFFWPEIRYLSGSQKLGTILAFATPFLSG
jgi:hypothetical protein